MCVVTYFFSKDITDSNSNYDWIMTMNAASVMKSLTVATRASPHSKSVIFDNVDDCIKDYRWRDC